MSAKKGEQWLERGLSVERHGEGAFANPLWREYAQMTLLVLVASCVSRTYINLRNVSSKLGNHTTET